LVENLSKTYLFYNITKSFSIKLTFYVEKNLEKANLEVKQELCVKTVGLLHPALLTNIL